jgi:Zn-dependent protease with chaperone function
VKTLLWIVINFSAAAGMAWLCNSFGLRAWRRADGAHWTERARLLWPVRMTAAINIVLIPILLHILTFWKLDPYHEWPVTAAAVAGAMMGNFAIARAMFPELSFRAWLREFLGFWSLRVFLFVMLLVTMCYMPNDFNWLCLVTTAAYLLLHFAFILGGAYRLLERWHYLLPPGERLRRIVSQTSDAMGIRPRQLFESEGQMALAFAFTTTGGLLVTRKTLEICSDEEVAAICAHELAHLSESRAVHWIRVVGSLAYLPLIFINPAIAHFPLGVPLLLVTCFAIIILRTRLTLKMEQRADKMAAGHALNETAYASALEKLHQYNQIPAVLPGKRNTHPDLYDRMLAAGVTPAFARPAAPRRFTFFLWLLILAVIALLVVSAKFEAQNDSRSKSSPDRPHTVRDE